MSLELPQAQRCLCGAVATHEVAVVVRSVLGRDGRRELEGCAVVGCKPCVSRAAAQAALGFGVRAVVRRLPDRPTKPKITVTARLVS